MSEMSRRTRYQTKKNDPSRVARLSVREFGRHISEAIRSEMEGYLGIKDEFNVERLHIDKILLQQIQYRLQTETRIFETENKK